jgi:hypothetical protein
MPRNSKGQEVLGQEWGNLAGLPAEQALKYVAQHAADLEGKLEKAGKAPRGGENDGDDTPPNSLDIARSLKSQSVAPLGAEFVGKREAARRQARSEVERLGYVWGDVESIVEQAMSGTTADQQTEPKAWIAAFVYAYGQSDLTRRMSNPNGGQGNPNSPPRSEYDDDVVVEGSMNSGRGGSNILGIQGRPKIDDPTEQRTKRGFEKVLGYRIPDEEWIALQDPDKIKTQEDWELFQDSQKPRGGVR